MSQIFTIFLVIFYLNFSHSLNLCGDWIQYKDLKCIKVLPNKVTEDDALKNCAKLDPSSTLLTIHSKDEQDYLNTVLESYHNISLNAWIGLKYIIVNKVFKWTDGTNMDYINWSEDAVKDGSTPCVEMSLIKQTIGKWSDVLCKKTALPVCQKKPLLDLNTVKNALEHLEKQVNSIIPIGFLYTQLPNQSSPQQLWPNMKWIEVTKDFSGLFFRAEGPESEPFGKIQQANQSWISDAYFYGDYFDTWRGVHSDTGIETSFNQEKWIDLANNSHVEAINHLKFYTTGGEVRPKNTAIKIFKRIE